MIDEVQARCGPNSQSDVRHVSKLIAEKAAARREQEQQQAARRAALTESPSRSFVEWATAGGGSISGKVEQTACAERGSPEFGFCEGTRAEAPRMSLRFWRARPEAYRYGLSTSKPPSCQDLGEYRELRRWRRGTDEYELCELTDRRLRHLSALIVRSGEAYEMYIFSQQYPSLDPDFERRLRLLPQP